MKVFVYVASMVLATALMLGGTILIGVQSPPGSIGLQMMAIFALAVMIYGPLVLGSLTSYWNVTKTEGSRSYYRRWLWAVTGLQILGTVAIIVFAVTLHSPWWLPCLFIAGGAALTVFAHFVGRFMLRNEEANPRQPSWAPVTRHEVRKKVAAVCITYFAVFAITAAALAVVRASFDDPDFGVAEQLLGALGFAWMGASAACVIASLSLNRRLKDAVDRDLGTIRKISKVVLQNKEIVLDHGEEVAAAKYAAVGPTVLAFMLAYFILLELGLGTIQVLRFTSGQADGWTIGYCAVLVVTLVIVVPISAVRIRRARDYARAHEGLLPLADA
ncbi:hypothetical protein [Arthrobacter sp. TWP1-1]|uniref:hypothetical protein n=1 Tax=Arthrobacter sp. TWP1-1 TaxID=2804568 RepID=UPI003CF26DA0